MEDHLDDFNVSRMCEVLEVSRTSFYYFCTHNPSPRKIADEAVKEVIKQI